MADTKTENIQKNIKLLYKTSTTYGDKYGFDVWSTAFILIVFFVVISYFFVQGKFNAIKANWVNERCNPKVIPFAGLINGDESSDSKFDYTGKNFMSCTENIVKNVANDAFQPIYYLLNIIQEAVKEFDETLNESRGLIYKIRHAVSTITQEMYNKMSGIIISIIKVIIIFKDTLSKMVGALMTGMFTLIATNNAMVSFLTVLINGAIEIGLIAAAIITALLWNPFMIWLGVIFLAVFLIGAGYTIYLKVWLKEVLNIASGKVPPTPSCFDKNTIIKLANGEDKYITEVQLGDILIDYGKVTAIMELSSKGQDLYNLDGIIVTGEHRVFSEDGYLIHAKSHPNSYKIEDYREELIYCINTSTKNIPIKSYTFVDWDDIDTYDIYEIHMNSIKRGLLNEDFSIKDLHSKLECGFSYDTKIELEDGRSINISELNVNDVLRFGERVTGTVKISADKVENINEYFIDNKYIKCSGNVLINDQELGMINTCALTGVEITEEYLYNITTNTGKFSVNGIHVHDYSSGLEQHLNIYSKIYS
tara:strand:- start:2982 stop:4586 length:1605 start_codon:yes stop_codon:yes gene_type:complete